MHFIGIAEKQRAVGIGAFHRFDQIMQLLRLVGMREVVAFENVEHLDQLDAARRRRRHRDDVIAAIGAAHRRALDGAVVSQIVGGHHAARGLHGRGDFVRDRPLVEGARALARDRLERLREIALDQTVAGRHRAAVGFEENLRRRGPARQPRVLVGQRLRPVVGEGEAVARHRNRRRDQIGQRETAGAVFVLGQREAGDGAGHADGKRGIARFLRIGIALRIEKAFGVDAARRGFAIIDRGVVAIGEVDHHEAAAAEIAGARIADGQRKADRDRGIHRIAALLQNVVADAGRARLLRHHHAVLRQHAKRRRYLAFLRAAR